MGNISSLGIMGTNEISVKYGKRRPLETSGSIHRPKPCIQEDPEPEPVSIILPEPKRRRNVHG